MQVKLSVRTLGDEAAAVPAIRGAVRELDPRLALADIRTMEQIWERSLSGLREPVWLIGIFAAVSALLAALGLYGVVAHAVHQQRREIGIRMALGARSNDVLALIVRNVMVMIAAGLVIGLAGAAALTRVTHEPAVRGLGARPDGVRRRRYRDGGVGPDRRADSRHPRDPRRSDHRTCALSS